MKTLLFVVLSMFSLLSWAGDAPTTSAPSAQDAQYDYTHDLDIAKIVRISSAAAASSECGPLKARMVYVDSQGVSHTLEYTRLGEDCEKS